MNPASAVEPRPARRVPARPQLMVPRQAARASWQDVEGVLTNHYHEPDLQAARAFFASIAAHGLNGQPVWPMVVGPPGSMKTEMLKGIDPLQNVHFIDAITAQTFISGQIVGEGEDAKTGLLSRVGESGILVYPDFSTVLAMKAEARASILADMRRIYDGELSKEFGTVNNLGQRKWQGRITFAVAATPDVDRHYSIFQSLGERFVMIRWARPDGIQAAMTAMNQDFGRARADLQAAVKRLFDSLLAVEPTLPERLQQMIAALADFTTRARTQVARSGYTKEMEYWPEPESSTRLAQQLAQLAKGSALLDHRSEVNDDDYRLVQRVALDCIPAVRRRVIETLRAGGNPATLEPRTTFIYVREDLQSLGLLEGSTWSPLALDRVTSAAIIG